jgi:epsilon-lactone hydrolase
MLQAQKQPTLDEIRKSVDNLLSAIPIDSDISVEEFSIDGIPGEWVTAPNAINSRVFFFLHGGAYFSGSCKAYRELASRLSRSTASRVLTIISTGP